MTVSIQYDDECELLRDEVRRWLAAHCPMTEVRGFVEGEGNSSVLWRKLAELGWTGLLLPNVYGGAGLGFTEAAVLFEETGRALLPAPLLPNVLAAIAILYGGSEEQRATLLPDLASGAKTATLAHVEIGGAWGAADTRSVRKDGRLSGDKVLVWGGDTADWLIVPFREGGPSGRCALAIVDGGARGVERLAEVVLDPTRPAARVALRDVDVSDEHVLELDGERVFAHLIPRACTLLAAEQAGGADALLQMTAAYAASREQFGKRIGSFQAVKHPLVNVLIGVEQTRSLVYAAASALDTESEEAEELARMAKAHASDVYVGAASRAIQLHGGYGFTIDCDAQLFFKRAQASRPAWGDATHHRRRLADRLIDESRQPCK